jgi:pSer/pThr/pTyr-binding forkhead associated (FHA) protein
MEAGAHVMTDNEPDPGRGRANDPTTMRLPGIGVPVEPLTEADPDADATLSAHEQATVDALRHGTALLVVLRGPNAGARFLLDSDEVSTGRHPNSDIFLDDVTVSRKHATFRREGDVFLVRDVGSLNGTYVNRERIDEAALKTRDEVQIGKFRLVFYAGAAQ